MKTVTWFAEYDSMQYAISTSSKTKDQAANSSGKTNCYHKPPSQHWELLWNAQRLPTRPHFSTENPCKVEFDYVGTDWLNSLKRTLMQVLYLYPLWTYTKPLLHKQPRIWQATIVRAPMNNKTPHWQSFMTVLKKSAPIWLTQQPKISRPCHLILSRSLTIEGFVPSLHPSAHPCVHNQSASGKFNRLSTSAERRRREC